MNLNVVTTALNGSMSTEDMKRQNGQHSQLKSIWNLCIEYKSYSECFSVSWSRHDPQDVVVMRSNINGSSRIITEILDMLFFWKNVKI